MAKFSNESIVSKNEKSSSIIETVSKAVANCNKRPSWDEYFMTIAILLSCRSSCERLNVGCVFVSGGKNKNHIITAGYNGFLPGLPHVSHMRDGHEQATVHAEHNAIADAARRGVSIVGSTVYITHFPCINCAKLLAASGVTSIKYHLDYKNDPLVHKILQEAKIVIIKL